MNIWPDCPLFPLHLRTGRAVAGQIELRAEERNTAISQALLEFRPIRRKMGQKTVEMPVPRRNVRLHYIAILIGHDCTRRAILFSVMNLE